MWNHLYNLPKCERHVPKTVRVAFPKVPASDKVSGPEEPFLDKLLFFFLLLLWCAFKVCGGSISHSHFQPGDGFRVSSHSSLSVWSFLDWLPCSAGHLSFFVQVCGSILISTSLLVIQRGRSLLCFVFAGCLVQYAGFATQVREQVVEGGEGGEGFGGGGWGDRGEGESEREREREGF